MSRRRPTKTANLIFELHHDDIGDDLGAATAVAIDIADEFRSVMPGRGWRSQQDGPVHLTEGLSELVDPRLVAVEVSNLGFSWGLTSGAPPHDLYLTMSVGAGDGQRTSGKARFRFKDEAEFVCLTEVYDSLASRRRVDRLHLSLGVAFHLDQAPDTDEQGRRPPTIGWRNHLRLASGSLPDFSTLPEWVSVESKDEGFIDVQLGPDPANLTSEDAIAVRNILMDIGLLSW